MLYTTVYNECSLPNDNGTIFHCFINCSTCVLVHIANYTLIMIVLFALFPGLTPIIMKVKGLVTLEELLYVLSRQSLFESCFKLIS